MLAEKYYAIAAPGIGQYVGVRFTVLGLFHRGRGLQFRLRDGRLHWRDCFHGAGLNPYFRILMSMEAGAGRDEVAKDDVFLQAHKIVDFARQGRFG